MDNENNRDVFNIFAKVEYENDPLKEQMQKVTDLENKYKNKKFYRAKTRMYEFLESIFQNDGINI